MLNEPHHHKIWKSSSYQKVRHFRIHKDHLHYSLPWATPSGCKGRQKLCIGVRTGRWCNLDRAATCALHPPPTSLLLIDSFDLYRWFFFTNCWGMIPWRFYDLCKFLTSCVCLDYLCMSVSHVLLNNAHSHNYTQCWESLLFFWCLSCLTSQFCWQRDWLSVNQKGTKIIILGYTVLCRICFYDRNNPELFWMV